MAAQLLPLFVIPASLVLCSIAGAQQSPAVAEAVPLPDDEIQQITLSLLQRYPQLAASPGVKAASAPPPETPGFVGTTVIYHPHTERLGIKEAYEAHCLRQYPDKAWTCEDVTIRRYLQLDSQSWEVRVLGDISADAASALIDGSRRDLQAGVPDMPLPSTAILITPHTDGDYRITWGIPDGRIKLTMLAHLTEGGDPENPEHWHAIVLKQ